MRHKDYIAMQEDAEMGKVIAGNVKAFFDEHDVTTMGQLQRAFNTDAGISVSFELHYAPEGKSLFVYPGDERARTLSEPWNYIRAIGFSSIVEGSDAEVPLTWIDAADDRFCDEGGEARYVDACNRCADETNAEACALWHEANDEQSDDDDGTDLA